MSEQKIYVFTTDHLLTIEGDEREIKEGWLIFMDFDSEWLLRTSGRACIIIPNKVIDELLQSGTIIDYPEPTMVSNDLTGVELKIACDKVEVLEKELNLANKKIATFKDCNPHQHATQQIQERFKTKRAYTKKDMLQVCIILSTVSSIVSASFIVCFIFDNI